MQDIFLYLTDTFFICVKFHPIHGWLTSPTPAPGIAPSVSGFRCTTDGRTDWLAGKYGMCALGITALVFRQMLGFRESWNHGTTLAPRIPCALLVSEVAST